MALTTQKNKTKQIKALHCSLVNFSLSKIFVSPHGSVKPVKMSGCKDLILLDG